MATVESLVPLQARPKQNWVVNPTADMLFVIAAPVLALLLFAPIFYFFGISAVLFIFFGFNLGHHVPTFIRVYGDRDLLERFRWNLLLGPVVPFTFAMTGVAYLVANGYTIKTILFLYLVLNIWDPWHFLMQNHGFMRIYDRHNRAPRKLAGRMDLAIGWAWFIYIMIGAVNWLPDLLYSIQRLTGIGLLSLFRSGVFSMLEGIAFAAAMVMSAVYIGYLMWCIRRGYYVSYAKLTFFVVMYGVMYLTYVPNPLMQRLVPGWTYFAGFATLGMVHVSQYLAIVWKYNRNLAERGQGVREGFFKKMFGQGGASMLILYVALCLAYGFGLRGVMALNKVETSQTWEQVLLWIAGTALAINFTSTITHYYYDGFIWKLRHKENRQNLAMQETGDSIEENTGETMSWWESRRASPALKTLMKHSLYFGLPMLIVTIGAGMVRNDPERHPDAANLHFQKAESFRKNGMAMKSLNEFKAAIAALDKRIETEHLMIEIRPTPSHFAMLAQAIDFRTELYTFYVAPYEKNASPEELLDMRFDAKQKTIEYYQLALDLPESLGPLTTLNLDPKPRDATAAEISQLQAEVRMFVTARRKELLDSSSHP